MQGDGADPATLLAERNALQKERDSLKKEVGSLKYRVNHLVKALTDEENKGNSSSNTSPNESVPGLPKPEC